MSASSLTSSSTQTMQEDVSVKVMSLWNYLGDELPSLSSTELSVLANIEHTGFTLDQGSSTLENLNNLPQSINALINSKKPISIVATKQISLEPVRRPNFPYATKTPSPLGPYKPESSKPIPSSTSLGKSARKMYKSVLVRAASKAQTCFCQSQLSQQYSPSSNHHPRFATVLGGKLNCRFTPYPAPQAIKKAKRTQIPLPPVKSTLRLPALPNNEQDAVMRGFIKSIQPDMEGYPPSEAISSSHEAAGILSLPAADSVYSSIPDIQLSTFPSSPIPSTSSVAQSEPDASPVHAQSIASETPQHVQRSECDDLSSVLVIISPEPVHAFGHGAEALQLPEGKEEAEPTYDPVAHAARIREVFRDLFTPSPTPTPAPPVTVEPFSPASTSPPGENRTRSPSPPTSDEGYEGSGTDEDDVEIDQLVEEEQSETRYQTPAYRKPLATRPTPEDEALQDDAPIIFESRCPQQLVPPPRLPQKPPRLFIPSAHHTSHPVTTSSSNTLNWARRERSLEPRPKAQVGWDKTKRPNRQARDSHLYYHDRGAKPIPSVTHEASKPSHHIFTGWVSAIKAWYGAGRALFELGEIADTEQSRRKKYERALKRALEADEGIVLGVRNMHPPEVAWFVEFLRVARGFVVDERWGMDAVGLKRRIEEYAEVVQDKLRVATAV